MGPDLTITKEVSETITGNLISYTTGLVSSTPNKNNGFYVTFTFEVGYKKYTFTADNNWDVAAHGQNVPLTTIVGTIAADTIGSYNQGKSDGQVIGYNDGYKEGKNAGFKEGYAKG